MSSLIIEKLWARMSMILSDEQATLAVETGPEVDYDNRCVICGGYYGGDSGLKGLLVRVFADPTEGDPGDWTSYIACERCHNELFFILPDGLMVWGITREAFRAAIEQCRTPDVKDPGVE